METHFPAAMSRIQEIETRLGIVHTPPPVTNPAGSAVSTPTTTGVPDLSRPVSPFPILLEQAQGHVRLKSLGPVAGPFTPEIEGLIARYANQNGLPIELV